MTVRVGINGFGRIGRNVYRAFQEKGSDVDVVAVNDLTDTATLAHLLQYDSVLGRYHLPVVADQGVIRAGEDEIRVLSERDPGALGWGDLGVDVVVESTGRFTKAEDARRHVEAGAGKVVISAPAKGEDLTVVLGVNDDQLDASHTILSNASCTTNCVAPMVKVLDDVFGVQRGFMTTVHAYTNDQSILDQPHKDLRRARAAAVNTIPTSTGAAKAVGLVLPHLQGKLDGFALRVPVPDGSITDLVVEVDGAPTRDDVNTALREAAQDGPLAPYVLYSEDPLVSSDIVGTPWSVTFDGLSTMTNGSMVKVVGWYDNEWGYSHRVVDLVEILASL